MKKAESQKRACKQKPAAYVWSSNKGFTMLEALVALTVVTACAASVPLLYTQANYVLEAGKAESNVEWELFMIQLRNELHGSTGWHVSGSRILYTPAENEESTASIGPYLDKIRRQVNGQGHEVMLQNVDKMAVAMKGGKLYIHVSFSNGEEESAVIFPLHP